MNSAIVRVPRKLVPNQCKVALPSLESTNESESAVYPKVDEHACSQ